MLEAVVIIIGALAPVIGMILKDYVERQQKERAKNDPIEHQAEVDYELLTDKPAFSVRLSRLHERIRAGRPSAE